MSVVISARERAAASGFAVKLSGRGLGIAGTTPPAGSVEATGRGLIEKIGAGCGTGWRYSALIRIAPAQIIKTNSPMASTGLRPSARRSSARTPPSLSNSAESTVIARSRTFFHPDICDVCRGGRLGQGEMLDVRRRLSDTRRLGDTRPLAIDWQTHRDGGA